VLLKPKPLFISKTPFVTDAKAISSPVVISVIALTRLISSYCVSVNTAFGGTLVSIVYPLSTMV